MTRKTEYSGFNLTFGLFSSMPIKIFLARIWIKTGSNIQRNKSKYLFMIFFEILFRNITTQFDEDK